MSEHDTGKIFPPLEDDEAWAVSDELLADLGCSAEEAKEGVVMLKLLAALGLDVAEAKAFIDECEDVEGSAAWRRLHQ